MQSEKALAAAPERAHLRARRRSLPPEAWIGYLLVAPSLLGFFLFIAAPILGSFGLSFYRWDVLSPARWVGLANYRQALTDPLLATVWVNTFKIVALDVPLQLVGGLVLAALADRVGSSIARYAVRSVVFFPVIVSGVAVALIWQWLMSTSLGIINYYLGLVHIGPVGWLDSGVAPVSVVLVDVWRSLGFMFVVFTAGLQGIPRTLYEAAAVDGALGWQRFWRITLPLLSPTTFFLLVISLINTFQFFDLPYVMTQGGPGDATRTVVFDIYDTAFHAFNIGYASVMAILLFLLIAGITLVQMRISRRWVIYDR